MKTIGESSTSVFENTYKPKEPIDWEEIERQRRQHDPQFGVLNVLFGLFNIINFIIQDLLLSEWKKVIKSMLATQENAIIKEFTKDEIIEKKLEWNQLITLKNRLNQDASITFKTAFQKAFYQLDIAIFNDDIDIAFKIILPLLKEFNKRNSYQALKPFCSLDNNN